MPITASGGFRRTAPSQGKFNFIRDVIVLGIANVRKILFLNSLKTQRLLTDERKIF